MKKQTGALIERGKIKEIKGENEYVIVSLDRDGIESPPMGTINEDAYLVVAHTIGDTSYTIRAQAIIEHEYEVGDMVYFFLFPDGTGKILCKV